MSFSKRTIIVNGVKVNLDVDQELYVGDIDEAQRHVAVQMGFWASVWASAEGEAVMADAYYRRWRGKMKEELLKQKPKPAVDALNAIIEADKRFYELKQAIALTKENATLAKGMFQSFDKKANLAQSLGAKEREVYAKTGKTTPVKPRSRRKESSPPTAAPKSTVSDDEKERLKGILKKGK